MSQIETTTEQTLQIAIEAQKLGKLKEAEAGYRAVLEIKPNHPDANHNLGVLAVSMNKPEVALPLFKIALETNPNQGQFWISYVDALIKDKQFDNAKSILEQGKKKGLAGERVDRLTQQLTLTVNKQGNKSREEKKQHLVAAPIQTKLTQKQGPSQADIDHFLKRLQKQDHRTAKKLATSITQKFPQHPLGWKMLGVALKQLGELSEAVIANQKAVVLAPTDPEAHYNLSNRLREIGRLEDSVAGYRKATVLKPDYVEAHYNLSITLQELGRLEDAEISYKKAIVIKPDYLEAHNNLGITLKALGRLDEAETSYKKAIAIKPDYAEAHNNLGIMLQELGRLEDAETSYKKVIAIEPAYAEAHNNLGIALKELGRLDEAETSYRKAIAIKPDYAEAHNNLANIAKELGRLEEAETSYKNAIAIKPDYLQAYCNLGATFLENSKLSAALYLATQSIKIKPTFEAQSLFVEIAKKIDTHTWDPSLAQLAITALHEPWGRPSDLIPFACRLLKADKEFVRILVQSKDDASQANFDDSLLSSISKKEFDPYTLLCAGLTSSPIPDAEIEILLTSLRRHLLKEAGSVVSREDQPQEIAALYCSLAQQCFINEYVYFQTPEEIDESERLRDRLKKALESEQAIPAVWAIAVACYFPLYSIVGVEKLFQQKWPDDVGNVLIQQIQEPLAELNLRGSIPALTSIDNQVSLVVQSQYEEHPYPRWVRLPKGSNKQFLNSYIQSKFRLSAFSRLVDDRNPEVLIAGCGTGQHSIGTSQSFKGAKILAIDLSMASLAYAKRKTIESNIESIEYAQADILKLGSLGRTFDVIESSGVLHHLENPFEGWEVLLSLLRPHGLMRLGFYSELARRDIVSIRGLIDQEGVGSSTNEIRNYRKYFLESNRLEDYGSITNLFDFFSTSMCRDLLFHVQEHRMNLNILARFFKDHDLNFLGFDIDMSVIQSYKRRFSDDSSATNLDNWRVYEEENPDTFIGMYQFWVQKIKA